MCFGLLHNNDTVEGEEERGGCGAGIDGAEEGASDPA